MSPNKNLKDESLTISEKVEEWDSQSQQSTLK